MNNEDSTGPGVAQIQLVCMAVLLMPIAYMAVALGIHLMGTMQEGGLVGLDENTAMIMTAALMVGGIMASAISIPFKRSVLRTNAEGVNDTQSRFKATLIAMAMSESGAVAGLVLILLTGGLVYGALLCGISFAISCMHFPSRYWLENGDDPL